MMQIDGPPEMTNAKVRRRMAREVLQGTQDRLHGKEASIPIGIDPKTGDLRTEMPLVKVRRICPTIWRRRRSQPSFVQTPLVSERRPGCARMLTSVRIRSERTARGGRRPDHLHGPAHPLNPFGTRLGPPWVRAAGGSLRRPTGLP